ncbi:MAG: PTS sugar transporter subunit IIA [Verrucomicrobiota bacterium]
MTNPSEDLVTPQAVVFSLQASSREECFKEMIEFLISEKLLPADLRKDVLTALEARESQLTTAIGKELALPHASVKGLPSVVRLIARSSDGIDCDAPDKDLVKFFYLSLIPDTDYSTHLRTIAAVSKFFHEPDCMRRIKSSTTAKELLDAFSAKSANA